MWMVILMGRVRGGERIKRWKGSFEGDECGVGEGTFVLGLGLIV